MHTSASCTTSWDDGHLLDQRLADLLAKYGLTGTFYVSMGNSRPVMTPAQIRQLSQTFELGAHTMHHVVLTDVPEQTAEGEIRDSKKSLEDITGRPCEVFCFPKGRFRRSHLDMVRRAGFHCVRTAELLSTAFPVRRSGIQLIPTTVQAMPHHWTTYVRNCAKRLAARNMIRFATQVRSKSWTQTAHALLSVVAQRGGVFHLWGHSWEIEEQQQWPQLESVFREMQQWRSIAPCVPNSKLASLAQS